MAYDPKKAALYNQLRQRGLSEDEAWSQSGIPEAETFNYVIGTNGELGANISRGSKVAGVDYERPSAAEQAESDRWFQSLESGNDDEPPARTSGVFARTTYPQAPSGLPAQQPSVKTIESTTTAQETVTGGSETITRVGAYERRDTSASLAAQSQLDQTNLEIERRKEVLRAEGKNFREMNRDPELFELKAQATRQEIAVENAKQTVEIAPPSIVTRPGPSGTTFQQSVDQQFLTTKTAGEDPTASLSEYDNFTSSGGPVQNFQANPVSNAEFLRQFADATVTTETVQTKTQQELLADIAASRVTVEEYFARPVVTQLDIASSPPPVDQAEFFQQFANVQISTQTVRVQPEEVSNPPNPQVPAQPPPGDAVGSALVREPGQDDFQNEQDNLIRAQERETEEFILAQRRAEASDTGAQLPPTVNPADDPQVPRGPAFDDEGNLNPGFTLDGDGNAIFIGDDFIDPSLTASAEASRQQATLNRARQQATIQSQRKQGNDTDWRFRISLAPQSTYLYNAPDRDGQPGAGILAPLRKTNGVIFPYTPSITTTYEARYSDYELTHSNYRGLFYQGSKVSDLQIDATFTAQDTAEAEYLLAVIHFFRSITKMFYGQDPERGTPPPLVYLRGFGEYQFNLHPCVVAQFNYKLPNDVDYIRARSKNTALGSLLQRRDRKSLPTNVFTSAWERLSNAGLPKGAQPVPPPVPSLGIADATYVPTKLDITLMVKPIQSREQVSRQFSLRQYANGDLLKGGFW